MAINIISKSTWRSDLAEKLDFCRLIKIPIYVVYPTYHVAINIYKPPFLRVYILQENADYKIFELQETVKKINEKIDPDTIIDVSDKVPFRLGLKQLEQKHQGDLLKYRLVLIRPDEDIILLTEKEKKDLIIEEQGKKLEEQGKKLENLDAGNKKLKQELSRYDKS